MGKCSLGLPSLNKDFIVIIIIIIIIIIDFRVRYVNADFCIMGDLNARTGIADDFLVNSKYDNCQPDDELEMLTLSSLNIQVKRVSVDNRLLELCKSANMYIVNGRFDNDSLQGKATCDNVSVVDYVICSQSTFSYIDNFIVQYYDPMLSDIYCAVMAEHNISRDNDGVIDQNSVNKVVDEINSVFHTTAHGVNM